MSPQNTPYQITAPSTNDARPKAWNASKKWKACGGIGRGPLKVIIPASIRKDSENSHLLKSFWVI